MRTTLPMVADPGIGRATTLRLASTDAGGVFAFDKVHPQNLIRQDELIVEVDTMIDALAT